MPRLPDFLVIGAAKCGTTSLAAYLGAHQEIFMADPKELRFFSHNWEHGLDWYAKHFKSAPSGHRLGEASPQYTYAPLLDGIPERVASVIPDTRLIYLVRDPIEQMRSYYRHRYARGREQAESFDLAVRENPIYIATASYGFQVSLYMEQFTADQLLIVDSADLLRRRNQTLGVVLAFLGVSTSIPDVVIRQELNRGSEKEFLPRQFARPRQMWRKASAITGKIPHSLRSTIRHALASPPSGETLELTPMTRKWVRSKLEPDMEVLPRYAGGRLDEAIPNWLVNLNES